MSEYNKFVDEDFLIRANVDVPFITARGEWAISRNKWNTGRGDEASIENKAESFEKFGWLETGATAFLVAHEDPKEHDKYSALHMATRVQGLHKAWLRDPQRKNRGVQAAVARGLLGSKIYRADIHHFAAVFLKDLGNITNADVTEITIIEVFDSALTVDEQYSRKRKALQTKEDVSKTKPDDFKFGIADQIFPNRWKNFSGLEACITGTREMRKALNSELQTVDGKIQQLQNQILIQGLCFSHNFSKSSQIMIRFS